jgi:hypothetical protein
MSRNEYGTMGPQHTRPNPTQTNGMNPPRIPPSQADNDPQFQARQTAHKEELWAGRFRAEKNNTGEKA